MAFVLHWISKVVGSAYLQRYLKSNYLPHFRCKEVAFGFPCGLGGAHCPGLTGSVQMWQTSEYSETPPLEVHATRTLYCVPGRKLSQMHSKSEHRYTVCQPVLKN